MKGAARVEAAFFPQRQLRSAVNNNENRVGVEKNMPRFAGPAPSKKRASQGQIASFGKR